MPDLIPTEVAVDTRTDEALRLLRRERDHLLTVEMDFRETLMTIHRIAIDHRQMLSYRLERILTLSRVALVTGQAAERRTVADRVRAWWQTVRAR